MPLPDTRDQIIAQLTESANRASAVLAEGARVIARIRALTNCADNETVIEAVERVVRELHAYRAATHNTRGLH